MKKHLLLIAGLLSLMMLASCSMSFDNSPLPQLTKRGHTVHFKSEDLSTKTNMVITDETSVAVYWDEVEDVRVWENDVEGTDVATVTAADGSSAAITATFADSDASSFNYHAIVASNFDSSDNPVLPSVQYPRAASYDPEAEILIGKTTDAVAERPSQVSLCFGRAAVLARMRLTGFENAGEKVSYVLFQSSNPLSGSIQVDYDNVRATYPEALSSNKIELIYTANNEVGSGKTFDTYFTAFPGATGGFKIVVKTDKYIYTKDLPSSTTTFDLGTVKNLNINLSTAEKAPIAFISNFHDRYWGTTENSWIDDNAAYQYSNVNSGVMVPTSYSGAGAHTAASLSRVDSVTVRYCTNINTGAGSITFTKGSDSITQDFNSDGGTSSRYLHFDFHECEVKSGALSFTVDVTQNSIYVQDIVVYGTHYLDPELTLSNAGLTLLKDDSAVLSATTAYSDTPTVSYVSDNTAVATVASDGTVSAVALGTARITVYVEAGNFAGKDYTSAVAYCYVSVKESISDPTDVSATILDHYEIPAVYLKNDDKTCASGGEYRGDTDWNRFTTTDSDNSCIVAHTFSYSDQTLRNFTLYFDKSKKCALWVACEMNGDKYPSIVTRSDDWRYDPAIDDDWQADLSSAYADDSEGVTYDRGHQVAAGDRLTTVYQNNQTFYYSNMTPQNSSLNRGTWKSLEACVQDLGYKTTGADTLYYVTGPIFEEGFISTNDASVHPCAVPSKYYKCIMKCTFDGGGNITAADGAAYILNNEAGATRQAVTIDYVEMLTGFDFFAKVPDALQNAAESTIHVFF